MITIRKERLKELATAYVEDGLLKKWRYDHPDEDNINSILHCKFYSEEPVTKEEMDYILSFDNVIVVNHDMVNFHNFKLNNVMGVDTERFNHV